MYILGCYYYCFIDTQCLDFVNKYFDKIWNAVIHKVSSYVADFVINTYIIERVDVISLMCKGVDIIIDTMYVCANVPQPK